MEGIITKGTTLGGRAVNAGDRVEISPDDFQKLSLTGDIEKIPEPTTEVSVPESDQTESPKPKKKGK